MIGQENMNMKLIKGPLKARTVWTSSCKRKKKAFFSVHCIKQVDFFIGNVELKDWNEDVHLKFMVMHILYSILSLIETLSSEVPWQFVVARVPASRRPPQTRHIFMPVSFLLHHIRSISHVFLQLISVFVPSERRKPTWKCTLVKFLLCLSLWTHDALHESPCAPCDLELMAAVCTVKRKSWESSAAVGRGKRKRRQRGSSGDKTCWLNPLDEASAFAPLCLSAIQRLQQDRMGTWKID